jgi:uncharacterized protein YrrD
MQFKHNATVVSADGKDMGHIRRVVLDPKTDEVKDIVVRAGTLLTDDRVVPVDQVSDTDGGQIHLRTDAGEVEKLPRFEESHFVPLEGEGPQPGPTPAEIAPAYYWYPPLVGLEPGAYVGSIPPELLGYRLQTDRNIPTGTVALKEGAAVRSRDDHAVGRLDQVLTAPGTDLATHLVIVEGMLKKTHKVVPVVWIDTIADDLVRLAVRAIVLERLPEYKPERP